MMSVVLTIIPVFVLIAIGYAAVRSGYISDTMADALNAFAVKLAVPTLLFTSMVRIDLGQAFSGQALVSFYSGALLCLGLGTVFARYLFKRRPGEAVAVGFSATFSNSLLLGFPIVERAFGPDALVYALGIIAFHAPVLYTVGMIMMEMMRRDGRPLSDSLSAAARSIATNPLIVGITAGLAVNLTGIELPMWINDPLGMLAAAAIPAALVGMGATLTRYKVTANAPEIAMVSGLSLLIHPAIAFVLAHIVFAMPTEAVLAIVTVAAMPPGINVYIFANLYDRAVGLAASALLVATALAIITVSAWLHMLTTVTG